MEREIRAIIHWQMEIRNGYDESGLMVFSAKPKRKGARRFSMKMVKYREFLL